MKEPCITIGEDSYNYLYFRKLKQHKRVSTEVLLHCFYCEAGSDLFEHTKFFAHLDKGVDGTVELFAIVTG